MLLWLWSLGNYKRESSNFVEWFWSRPSTKGNIPGDTHMHAHTHLYRKMSCNTLFQQHTYLQFLIAMASPTSLRVANTPKTTSLTSASSVSPDTSVGRRHATRWRPEATPRPHVGCPSLLLPVHGGQHEGDVRSEKVIHLVTQTGLAEESTASHQVTDGHVEIVGATAPVGDLCEGVYG